MFKLELILYYAASLTTAATAVWGEEVREERSLVFGCQRGYAAAVAGNVQDRQAEGQVGREVALRAISCVCAYGASTREIGTAFRHARGLEESRLSDIKTEREKHVRVCMCKKLEMRL